MNAIWQGLAQAARLVVDLVPGLIDIAGLSLRVSLGATPRMLAWPSRKDDMRRSSMVDSGPGMFIVAACGKAVG